MNGENTPELHVARPKGMQHATFERLDATPDATPVQHNSLKALANKVLERNKVCNSDATVPEKPCNKPCNSNTQNLRGKMLPIWRVLSMLRDVKPYRICGAIACRSKPTKEQQHLLAEYQSELIDALTPRALTKRECEDLALWLQDIGEIEKRERDYVFTQAESSPTDRVALLWQAEGSPRGTEAKPLS